MKPPKTGLLHAAMQAGVKPVRAWCRWPSPTTSCSRTGPSRRQGVQEAPARRSRASWPRWWARRSATDARAYRHVRAADRRGRLRSRVAQGRARPGAPHARRHRPALQGAADGARRRRDAAVDRARGPRRRASAPSLGSPATPPAPTSLERDAKHVVDDGVERARAARRHPRGNGPRSACATATCCATTRDRSSTCCPAPPHDRTRRMLDALSKSFFHALARSKSLERMASRVRHGEAHQLRPPLHRRRERRRGDRGRAGHPGERACS